jgi:hypothetical protein
LDHKGIAVIKKQLGFANTRLLNNVGILAFFEHTTTSSGIEAGCRASSGPLGAGLKTGQVGWGKVQDIGIVTLSHAFEDLRIAG